MQEIHCSEHCAGIVAGKDAHVHDTVLGSARTLAGEHAHKFTALLKRRGVKPKLGGSKVTMQKADLRPQLLLCCLCPCCRHTEAPQQAKQSH